MSDYPQPPAWVLEALHNGLAIPAHPLALTADRKLDERRQRALTRYYYAAGAGGVAVGVHTTQFAIRNPGIDLLAPVLELAADTLDACEGGHCERSEAISPRDVGDCHAKARLAMTDYFSRDAQSGNDSPLDGRRRLVRIAGICGSTPQALGEARLACQYRYHAGLLSLAALPDADDEALLEHCRAVAQAIPLVGFYLQPAVGGRVLSYRFWRQFVEIPNVAAIKVAPFNRYQTLDVMRAVAEGGRDRDIALYTGNDDHIVMDLLAKWVVMTAGGPVEMGFAGGLLGHWACWTQNAVSLLEACKAGRGQESIPAHLLALAAQVTDCNAAFFDAAHQFAGSIPGIHQVLYRQGLLANVLCLNPQEALSPGQAEEIERVCRAYPHLNDDEFVEAHLEEWLG